MRFFLLLIASLVMEKSLAKEIKILAFGDSLTAGYQLSQSDAFPAQIEKLLREKKYSVKITNAGVSGDTSAQGLRRVDWVLKSDQFDLALLCLGANDGLRLLPLPDMEKNLKAIIQKFHLAKIRVILVGIKLPTNTDTKYQKNFEDTFPRVAKQMKVDFIPFLLEGVAASEMLNLEDQIHPNQKGHQIIAAHLLKPIESAIGKIQRP